MDLEDMHSFVKSIDGLNMINSDSANMLIDYLVNNGFDAEDFAKQLGLPRATSLLCRLCPSPDIHIKNPNFLVHIEDFILQNIPLFTRHQLIRLRTLCKNVERLSKQDTSCMGRIEERLAAKNDGGDKQADRYMESTFDSEDEGDSFEVSRDNGIETKDDEEYERK